MNAESLVGTVLGTCTLQQLIGQGGMGAVYLAQQSRPRRQVAVKVLLPATVLKPHHLAAFLERFRRETDAAASLEHPNIMPVYEYGERDGVAYLVMPYVSGGTLRDVMEREGQLALPKTINYLEQLAAALDFAHARGVVHRDIKPANILLTPEGRLLLTDFGLVKIVTEEGQAQVRLTGAGAPVGTPDYMSPEQVMGDEVDGRADLYSLGVILFQMVTGTTPFQGETPMQIAAQQLHSPPPAPSHFRVDLPANAEQVLLKALSKRPADRYPNGLELATAFRLALSSSTFQVSVPQNNPFSASGIGGSGMFSRSGLFDPKWQTGALAAALNEQGLSTASGSMPVPGAPQRTGLLSRTGMFPTIGTGATGSFPAANAQSPATPPGTFSTYGAQSASPQGTHSAYGAQSAFQAGSGMQPSAQVGTPFQFGQSSVQQMSPSLMSNTTTGALTVPGQDQGARTMKLTGPVKVVQVPVAPGQYVTGLLPIAPAAPTPAERPQKKPASLLMRAALAVVVLLIVAGSAGFWMTHVRNQAATNGKPATNAPGASNSPATTAAQLTATAQASYVFDDPLSQNIHNLPEGTSATRAYAFKGGAYHITNLGKEGVAVVVQYTLPNLPMTYSITMQEIKGDDTSPVNSFGLILRYSQQTKGGQTVSTFYSFEVVNTTGANGKYWFYKYDSSKTNPWTPLWSQTFGNEFHEGHGPNSINTIQVVANGSTFSFVVNGKSVGKPVVDKSYTTGYTGLLVNLQGTEIAFSNLLIKKN